MIMFFAIVTCIFQEIKLSLKMAKGYIETHLHLADDPYTAALTSYTLTLMKSEHAGTLLKWLNQKSTKRGKKQYM